MTKREVITWRERQLSADSDWHGGRWRERLKGESRDGEPQAYWEWGGVEKDMAPIGDDERQMIMLAAHRRQCHIVSHRGCRGFLWRMEDSTVRRLKCKPEKCQGCKAEATEHWQRQRNRLRLEGLALVKQAAKGEGIDKAALAARVAVAVVTALKAAGYLP